MYPSPNSRKNEFSEQERKLMLDLAHQSITSALEGRAISLEPFAGHLAEKRGAFCTLYLDGQLRGCVGYIFPLTPLLQTVAETARGAAFDDPRFTSVTSAENSRLQVCLSVLSPLTPIDPDQVEVGTHGLLVSQSGKRGVLLPQVPFEQRWDRVTFLEQTCMKAGLAPRAWEHGATVESFTAESFGDNEALM
jgi:AmmeMemoRadiSam system protein A